MRVYGPPSGRNIGNIVYPMTANTVAVGEQKFFIAGSGRLTLSLAGNVRALVRNPAGSGRTVYLGRIVTFGTGTAWASVFINPTAGLPTNVRPVTNAVFGSPVTAVGQLLVDTDTATPLSGGTDTGLAIGMAANTRSVLDLPPFVLSPGVSAGINVPFAGAADSSLNLYWWES